MEKWEYLFVEIVAKSGGIFHYRVNGKDESTDTIEWTSRRFFNALGQEGWELTSALIKDKEWSPGGMYAFKRKALVSP